MQDAESLCAKKISHLLLQLKPVQGHPRWVSSAGSVFFAKATLTEYCFAAPRGAPALTERLQRFRDPGRPCLRPWCPWYSKDAPVVIEIHPRSTGAPWEWQVRPVSNARMPGAPDIPRAHLASPGAPAIFTGASGVIEVHLQSTGAPWEWQVRPVSNKRMPGAPGIARCT